MLLLRSALALVMLSLFAASALADRRVALVVGNGDYQHADKLANPVTDARHMRDALTKLGFETVYGEDLDLRSLQRNIGRFAKAAEDADVALVFYAGHGSTFGDIPYVVPVDADYASLEDVPYEMLPLETLIGELRRAKGVRVAVIDACRDNSAERALKREATRGGEISRGQAPVRNPAGLIIPYATQYLSTAADGPPGADSPFTAALLRDIATPGIDIKDLLFKVAREVVAATNGKQRPEISVSLYEPYQLGGAAPPRPSPDEWTWSVVKTTTDAQVVATFLARLPADSPLRAEAEAKLASLRDASAGAAKPPGVGDRPSAEVASAPAPTSSTALPRSRAALLVEDASAPNHPDTYTGSVSWSTDRGPANGAAGPMEVRADVDLSSANVKASVLFRKNTDPALPASHTIELKIALGSGSKIGDVKDVRLQMRNEQAASGSPLSALSVPVADNYFLFGLASDRESVAKNDALLLSNGWFDVRLKLADGKVAKLTFEKGVEGAKILLDAVASWRQTAATRN
jgi:hypothetical protein